MSAMTVKVYDPTKYSMELTDVLSAYDYDIQIDYAQNPVSTFTVSKPLIRGKNIKIGSIIEVIEDIRTFKNQQTASYVLVESEQEYTKSVPYIGVVKAIIDDYQFEAQYIYNIFDFNIRIDNTEFFDTPPVSIYDTITRSIFSIDSKESMEGFMFPVTQWAHDQNLRQYGNVIYEDTSSTTGQYYKIQSVLELIIDWYKTHNIVLSAQISQMSDKFAEPGRPKQRVLELKFENVTIKHQPYYLKSNNDAFMNWEIVQESHSLKDFNKLTFIHPYDPRNHSSGVSLYLGEFFATSTGEVVTSFAELLAKEGGSLKAPIKNDFIEYNEFIHHNEDGSVNFPKNQKALYERACIEIGGFRSKTTVQFDVSFTNQIIFVRKDMKIGRLYNISKGSTFNDTVILSGYRMTSDNDLITLYFGYERETLNSAIKKLDK